MEKLRVVLASRDYAVTWGKVFSYTGNDWTLTPTERDAPYWSQVLHIEKPTSALLLHFNTTKYPLENRDYFMCNDCIHLSLFIYKSGPDPYKPFSVCKNYMGTPTPNTEGTQAKGPNLKDSVKHQVVVMEPLQTADDWFRVTTGISRQTNNWLLMTKSAANSSKTDCVVRMGPGPVLKIVPAQLPPGCIIDVMSKTVPSTNCRMWDDVYPLTKENFKKPVFFKIVAKANFTCFSMTGEIK